MSHEQVSVRHPSGEILEVDHAIALSLIALWKLGIATDYSCQGDDDCAAYISFADLASAGRFAEIVHRRTWTWDAGKASHKQPLRLAVRFTTVFRHLLGVISTCVEDVVLKGKEVIVDVKPRWRRPRCPECGEVGTIHETREPHFWRDLAFGETVTLLRYAARRVDCED